MRSDEATVSQLVMDETSETETEYWIKDQTGDKKLEDEYLQGDIIGRGNSSVIYKCLRKGRTEWACKILKKKTLNKKLFQSHIKTLMNLKHPNLVNLKEVFETRDEIRLIQEIARGGELFERIVEQGHYSEKDAARAVRQILNALQYLHNHGIIHKHLKPENLLYETEMDDSVLKLADYGMIDFLSGDNLPSSKVNGAFGYSAPEVLLNKTMDPSTDVWSLGVLTYIMLCGFEPFWDDAGETVMSRRITEGDYDFPSPWWDNISESAKELISQMLSVDPKRRPTAEEALNHPWTLGISTPTLHMDQTVLRLREFNAKRRFRVATKAVLATRRALNLLSPMKRCHEDKTEKKYFCKESKDGGKSCTDESNIDTCCCDCSLIDGSESNDANVCLTPSPPDGRSVGKTTHVSSELSTQYKENYAGLG